MSDMSKLVYPDQESEKTRLLQELRLAMTQNIEGEVPAALADRLLDAEQLWRFFCRRDEMNAEVHLEGEHRNVRYSPITIAAERVAGYLARLYYGQDVDYRTAMVESGGAPLRVGYTDHH